MNDTFETIKKNVITYFKGVKTEWGKITWPEKHQVVVETVFVVAIVFIFTVFIYFVDVIFNCPLSIFNLERVGCKFCTINFVCYYCH